MQSLGSSPTKLGHKKVIAGGHDQSGETGLQIPANMKSAVMFVRTRAILLSLNAGNRIMNTLVIEKKKYVVILHDDYKKLMKQASASAPSARNLSLAEGKKMAYALIDKWHKGK